MSNKKKSSIDLFAIALYEKGFLKGNGNDINDLLEEAKAMHKEEIESAWNSFDGKTFDQYYNETYGETKN
jgi:hypothetical protein